MLGFVYSAVTFKLLGYFYHLFYLPCLPCSTGRSQGDPSPPRTHKESVSADTLFCSTGTEASMKALAILLYVMNADMIIEEAL